MEECLPALVTEESQVNPIFCNDELLSNYTIYHFVIQNQTTTLAQPEVHSEPHWLLFLNIM